LDQLIKTNSIGNLSPMMPLYFLIKASVGAIGILSLADSWGESVGVLGSLGFSFLQKEKTKIIKKKNPNFLKDILLYFN
jgi:hypothetical protein